MREAKRTAEYAKYFQRLIDARAGSTLQLASYVAVAKGLRPALDDFIPVTCYEQFCRTMEDVGVKQRPDVVFGHVRDNSQFPSLAFSPTTKATGVPWDGRRNYDPGSEVHVFVGTTDQCADAAWRSGWYPVVIGGHIVPKPRIDHIRFGLALGYPECCVGNFSRFNQWGQFDHISESAKRSNSFPFVNNCFAKYTPYMLNFHIPCSFDCRASRLLGQSILGEIAVIDPDFAERIEARLKMPVLHVSERVNYGLIDATQEVDGRWRYFGVEDIYALITGKDRRHDTLKSLIEWGCLLEPKNTEIKVWNATGEQRVFGCIVDEGAIESPRVFTFQ